MTASTRASCAIIADALQSTQVPTRSHFCYDGELPHEVPGAPSGQRGQPGANNRANARATATASNVSREDTTVHAPAPVMGAMGERGVGSTRKSPRKAARKAASDTASARLDPRATSPDTPDTLADLLALALAARPDPDALALLDALLCAPGAVERASRAVHEIARRLDYLTHAPQDCPAPSPALARSLTRTMLREVRALDSALCALDSALAIEQGGAIW